MRELINRLLRCPIYSVEILATTLFITVLTLASPLFVIQVLNRYITYGFTGTLVTLASGMMIAIALQFAFRLIRTRIAATISIQPDLQLEQKVLNLLARAKTLQISNIPKPSLNETAGGLLIIKNAYNAASITNILDAPFAVVFILTSFLLSPLLAYISLAGILISLAAGAVSLFLANRIALNLQNKNMAKRGMVYSLINNIDMVRSFKAYDFLEKKWSDQTHEFQQLYKNDSNIKEFSQSVTLTLNVLMSTLLYTAGAIQVVQGNLTVGSLIGVNILAGRAFSSTTKFVQTMYILNRAQQAFSDINKLSNLPLEPITGTALSKYSGNIEFKDVHFNFPGTAEPIFESLSLKISAGTPMAITGDNGSGKTTLIRLLAGLLDPSRGNIQADQVSLKQIAPSWWRNQICYLPQELSFINSTVAETITMLNPEIDNRSLNEIISLADLRGFLDKSPKGLNTIILDGGQNLPQGIRRRLALARALATNGRLLLFDEPTEGLDDEGCAAVYNVLNKSIKLGKTIIVVSRDPKILKGIKCRLDLNHKPIPELRFV